MDGVNNQTNGESQADSRLIQALEVVHNPRSSNQHRQEAYQYLESVKNNDEAPYHGFILASHAQHPPIVRHFGLSLLEHAIKYKWQDYSTDQTSAVRDWIFQLTQNISGSDPAFIRNKIAQLWVEVAKRSWMLDWTDMDELLVKLWDGGAIEKFFVLEILENLSEISFGKEDAVAATRGDELSNACIDIFTPAEVFRKHYPKRNDSGARHGEDGWLFRIGDFLSWCLGQDPNDEIVAACAVKAASTLKSVLDWILLRAVYTVQLPDRLCQALTSSNRSLQLESLQCLFILYSRRAKFEFEDVNDLVIPMFGPENVDILRKLYEWSTVDPNAIDEERYLICKKLTPVLFQLGLFIEETPSEFFGQVDMDQFLNLMLSTVQSQSLHVSIPILHLWALFMNSPIIRQSPLILGKVASLLQICSERLVRYEDLPPDSNVPAVVFLTEDVETIPERHQFLGNYSRFAREVIDGIVQEQPVQAINHILGQTDGLLAHLYDDQPAFEQSQATRFGSIPAIKLDAQSSVIEAAVFGYAKWRSERRLKQEVKQEDAETFIQQQAAIDSSLERWSMQLLPTFYDDPTVQQKLVILLICIACGPLRKNARVVTEVFKYIMDTKARFIQKQRPGSDASMYELQAQELQRFCSHQLLRLAMKSPDFLIEAYDRIESQLQDYCNNIDPIDEDRERSLAIPFVILQRASQVPEAQRRERLESFVKPCLSGWKNPNLGQSLQSIETFCELLGLSGFQDEFLSQNAQNIQDWSEVPLKASGRALRERIETSKQKLPVRLTRTILGASIDRAEGPALELAKAVWIPHIATILPHLISLMRLAIAFSEPSVWAGAPPAAQTIIKRVMRDRFWQVGISTGSRDDFYNKVTSTKGTLEGLASTIRGCIRDVRETCFKILSLMTFLGDALYQFEELPQPLCEAMFSYPMALSLHQNVVLLETARVVVEQCPEVRKIAYLTPLLTSQFTYLDEKISREWELIDQKNRAASEDDDLTEEMKEESILRNLTFQAVLFVTRIFDPNPSRGPPSGPVTMVPGTVDSKPQVNRLDNFVYGNTQVFKSIILFCTHALRMHDSRSCSYIVRVLRSIIPIFAVTQADPASSTTTPQLAPEVFAEIREFMSTEVFKACITSLHDPYFVDIQGELALLIARIVTNYATLTPTPRNILLSLPDMREDKVDAALRQLVEFRNSKMQRGTVLKLLAGLRGVSIAEQGKVMQARAERRRQDPTLGKYAQGEVAVKERRNGEDDEVLDGVAGMFGSA